MAAYDCKKVSDEKLISAVALYYGPGASLPLLAESLAISERTVFRLIHDDPRWADAKDAFVEELKDQGLPAAWACLIRQAKAGDVSAAKELLNRIDKVVGKQVNLNLSGEVTTGDGRSDEERVAGLVETLIQLGVLEDSGDGDSAPED